MKVGSLLALTGLDLIVDDGFFKEVRREWVESMRARGEKVVD